MDARDSAFDACWRREGDQKLQMLPAVEEALSLVLGRREDSPLPLDHASISRFHARVLSMRAPARKTTPSWISGRLMGRSCTARAARPKGSNRLCSIK